MTSRRPHEDETPVELAALADGSIDPTRRRRIESRVVESPDLAALLAEQEQAVALTRGAAAEVEAPASLRVRVEAERGARRLPSGRRAALVGVAAAAVVAVGVWMGAFGSSPSGERFSATLGATRLVPDAAGSATLTKTSSGWRIELNTRGLPGLRDGRFYEAWLRNTAGVLVPIGTFNEGRRVTLWAGVSPERYRTLTVTRERADGVQGSSGEKVLVGTIDVGSR